jgi:ParB family chromosome partitioning protein
MADSDLRVDIKRIKADENNVRTKVQVKPIEGLAESIAEVGLLNPILLRPFEGDYKLIAGHRRFAAIAMLVDQNRHSGEIEAILHDGDISEADVTVMQLVENLQREDIDPLDEAGGYMRLLEFDMSQADIARKVGRSRAHVTKRLSLLALPEKAKAALRKEDITIEYALTIASLDAEDAEEFCKGRLDDLYGLQRKVREQKGKKVASKLSRELAATGLTIYSDFAELEAQAPDDQHYETQEVVFASSWDGSVPSDGEVAVVGVNGDEASGRIYKLVPNTNGRTADKTEKRAEAEKIAKREERKADQAKLDFLSNQLVRVKAKDADEIMLSLALDRLSYSTANEVCRLLDLEVPTKEETTYDGKVKNVKQYYPLVRSMVAEARENGDIGFLRRVVMATACAYGYKEQLLELYGYDPSAQADEDG